MIFYSIKLWPNKIARDMGEAICMSPMCAATDLDAVKTEVAQYDLDATGCIEIVNKSTEEPLLHYESGTWSEVTL
jgi:hypothetical protein